MARRDVTEVSFVGAINRVATLADGGIRLTLDLPEDAILEAAELLALRRAGVAVRVTIKQEDSE